MPSRCANTGTRASACTRATRSLPPRGTITSMAPSRPPSISPTAARSRVGTRADGGLRQAGLPQPLRQRGVDGAIGALALGAAAQDRRIAGLEAQHAGVGGDVGPALVDDADHAERHPHPLDGHAIGPRPALHDGADRILQVAHHLDPGRHRGDALGVERQPVQKGGGRAGRLGLGDVLGIGGEDVALGRPDRLRHRGERRVLLLRGRQRQHARGAPRLAADLAHQSGDIGRAFDGLEWCGHGFGPGRFLSCSAQLRERGGRVAGGRPPMYGGPITSPMAPRRASATVNVGDHRAMKLKDRVAVVTGAGRNIGEAVAELFAAEGAKVAVVDLDRTARRARRRRDHRAGGTAAAFVTDVSKASEVEALVKGVVERFGRIDILVNNVAVSDNKSILEITEADWDRVMNVTLKSQFLMSKQVAHQMIAQGGGGNILNVGSTSGWQGRRRAIAYSAAKGAIANFTRALAVQLAPHDIRVNAIVPNKIGSPVGREEFDPTRPVENMLKRPGQPDEAAKAILFLVSDDSSFIIGENLFVDGGTMAMDHTS